MAFAENNGIKGIEREHVEIRVLYIIARLNVGGPALHTIMLSSLFSKRGFRSCLATGVASPHEGDMSYLLGPQGRNIILIPSLGREISFREDVHSFGAIRKVVRRFKPHIIHTHTAKAGTLGRLVALSLNLARGCRSRIRLVHTFHGHVFHSYFGPIKTALFIQIERILAQFTDRIIAISPSQKRDICETYKIAGPNQVQVVPLGFDLSSFERLSPPTPQGILSVGIIGRLTHVKNHRMFLETVRILNHQGVGHAFKFFVVGDGELRDALTREVAAIGAERNVVFTGWQEEMPEVYRTLDAVVLTSLNEGTPVSLIEAMASARPVIATDVGGVKDLIGEIDTETAEGYKLARHGILIPSGDSRAMAEALRFVLMEKSWTLRVVERARKHVLDTYSLDRWIREMTLLYEGLIRS